MFFAKYLVFFLLFLMLQTTHAYQITDETAIMSLLPKNWTQRILEKTENYITVEIKNTSVITPRYEMIMYSIVKKNPANDALKNINNVYLGLSEALKVRCKINELKKISTPQVPFNEWVSQYQCDTTNSAGAIIAVDADPVTIYMVTYEKSKELPHQDMIKFLSSIIKICYKQNDHGHHCYFLSD
jgi:hypothetical protein